MASKLVLVLWSHGDRCWLVAFGRKAYEPTLHDPVKLALMTASHQVFMMTITIFITSNDADGLSFQQVG